MTTKDLQRFAENDLRVFRKPYVSGMRKFTYRGENPVLGDVEETRYAVPADMIERAEVFGGIVGGRKPSDYAGSIDLWMTLMQRRGIKGFYNGFDVSEEKFEPFLRTVLKNNGLLDLTITDPYKEQAYVIMKDEGVPLDREAEDLGAVNHMLRQGGQLRGYMTDGYGMRRALEQALGSLHGRQGIVVGAGGAAKAVAYNVYVEGMDGSARLVILNRTAEKAVMFASRLNDLARERGLDRLPVLGSGLDDAAAHYASSHWIVNAIPVGEPLSREDAESVPPKALFADTRYGTKAKFARLGESTGHPAIEGDGMLFWQFERAARLLEGELGKITDEDLAKSASSVGYKPKFS